MQARCPHCSSVFATDRTGIQFCPSCGQQINVPGAPSPTPSAAGGGSWDEGQGMGTPIGGAGPGFGGAPGDAGAGNGPTPWERRSELGLVKGFFENWKQVFLSPDAFWKRASPDGSLWDALSFSWLVSIITAVLSIPFSALSMGSSAKQISEALAQLPPEQREQIQKLVETFTSGGMMSSFGIGQALLYPIGFLITAGIVHLFCLIFGAGKNGFTATARALAYGAAPMLLSWIPCVGAGAWLYSLVLQIWGISALQRVSGLRAALAYFAIIIVACCCVCGIGAAVATTLGKAGFHNEQSAMR